MHLGHPPNLPCTAVQQLVCVHFHLLLAQKMAERDVPEGAIPDSFICPITQELMRDPVLLIADSQTYERSALKEWFDTGRRISPMTGLPVGSTNIKRNFALKTAIEVILRLSAFYDLIGTCAPTRYPYQNFCLLRRKNPPKNTRKLFSRGKIMCWIRAKENSDQQPLSANF